MSMVFIYALMSLLVTNHVVAFAPSFGMMVYNQKVTTKPLFLEKDEERDEGNYRSDIDEMRKMLETSWNGDTMGTFIPTSASAAASAAAESIFSALSASSDAGEEGRVLMVDISLPSFDPLSGPNVYDDIGAVEFCSELAKRINHQRSSCDVLRKEGRCAIIVKDGTLGMLKHTRIRSRLDFISLSLSQSFAIHHHSFMYISLKI